MKPHKRALITHEFGCSQMKGYECPGLRRLASFADSIAFRVRVILPSVGNMGWWFTVCLCVCGHHFQQTGHEPGIMVANPACGQLNRENGLSTAL